MDDCILICELLLNFGFSAFQLVGGGGGVEMGSKSRFRGWAKGMGFEGGEMGDVI